MLAGKRILGITDSTAFVGYDVGDPVPQAKSAYPSLIEQSNNVTFHNLAVPAAELDFQLVGSLFCGFRGNASTILAFMRGLGVDILSIQLGTNDWYQSVGVSRYANGLTSIANCAIAQGYTKMAFCTPFIRYYTGPAPTNGLGETLDDYCNAIPGVVALIKARHPTIDIRFIDTRPFIPFEAQYFLADGAHIRANAHALVAPALVAEWQLFNWL